MIEDSSHNFLQGGGKMGELIRSFDWSASPLGPVANWPTSLKIATGIMLSMPFPMYIAWGSSFTQLYNDGFRPILGTDKHPNALGITTKETFAEIWHIIGPMFDGVMEGHPVRDANFMLQLNRNGYPEDCYFDFSYSPIPDENGIIGGVLITVIENTEKLKATEDLKKAKDELEYANKLIEEERDKLTIFFMEAPGGVCVLNGPDLVYELINPAYQQLFPGRNLAGKPLLEAVPEIRDQPIYDILQNVYNNDETFEGRALKIPLARHTSGPVEDRYFDFIYQPRHNKNGKVDGIIVSVYEVTESVIANHLLEESEKRFRIMVEQSPVPMLVTKGSQMIFEEINTPMLELIDRDISIKGKPVYEIIPELQGQPVMEHLYNCFYSGQAWMGYEQPILIKRNGKQLQGYYNISYRPFFENGVVTGVLQSALDVTEQVNSRKKLEEAEDTLKLSLMAARLGTFDLDLENNFLNWDDRCRILFGINHQNPVSYQNDFVAGLHPDDRDRILKIIDEEVFVKEKSNGHYDVEYRTVGAEDGKVRWLRAMGKAYFDENNKPVRFIGTVLDITESKKDELRKNDFIAMVSHELKTPLTSLKGYIQLSQQEASTEKNTFINNMLDKADNHLNKMNELIHSFLNVSRLESGKIPLNKQPFVLDDLAKEITDETNLVATGHHIILNTCEPLTIVADKDKIGAVISNLLNNAVKYSPRDTSIWISCMETEDMIGISVQDEGIGIKPEDAEKIFERYYRVESKDSNTISGFGIGLYLSAEIIHRHGGKIAVESEPGKGSKFYFLLPK